MGQSASDPPTDRQLLTVAAESLRALLPDAWTVALGPARERGVNANLRLAAPDGGSAELAVDARQRVEARDVLSLARQLRAIEAAGGLVAARYLSPQVRAALRAEGLSYVDATGNVDVSVEIPAVALRATGADRDPWRAPDGPVASLKGLPAARVVRALVDLPAPWRMRELASEAGTSLGSTARTVELLDREALIERDARGAIQAVKRGKLLERWAADYDLARGRRVVRLLAPRGLEAVERQLTGVDQPYAVGGSLAARWQLSHAEPTTAILYTLDADRLERALRLTPAQTRANVLMIEPRDDLPLVRAQRQNDVAYTAPSQTVADLLNGPGRNPEEGRALLEWMLGHERDWRTK